MAFMHSSSNRLSSWGPRHCLAAVRVGRDETSIFFWAVLAISFEPLENRPAKHGVVAGPIAFDVWIGAQDHLHGFDLAVQVVEAMQDQRFWKHRQLGAAKLILAMMRDDEVLDEDLEFAGKVFNLSNLLVHNFEFQNHVPQELPFVCIAETAGVGEFPGFANVVNYGACEQKIQVDSLVVLHHQLAEFAER